MRKEIQDLFEIPPQPSDIDAILADLTKAIGNIGSVDFASSGERSAIGFEKCS